MRPFVSLPVLALAGALALGGCGPKITLTDDIDLTWDFALTFSRFDDTLHTPYVKGAPVSLIVSSSDEHQDLSGWVVKSSDPTIFRVDAIEPDAKGGGLTARGVAVGEGTAQLTVFDADGNEVGHGTAEVLAPDRVELDAHGYLILGKDGDAPVAEARILENGTATYLVRYFRGARELHGNGILSVDAPAGITATPRTTFLFENREWLTLTAAAVADKSIQLYADGTPFAVVPVITVPEADIAQVTILTQSEKGHDDGDWLVALAQAYDGLGRRVFGVDYAWDVDGVQETADGDLYRYSYKKGQYQMVTAARAGHSDTTMIQSDGGYVDSSNNIGCAAAPGHTRGAAPLAASALVGLVLVAARRRRR
jgi:hypothetical protein